MNPPQNQPGHPRNADRDRPSLVIVGRVRAAHGLLGEVSVELLTDTPESFFAQGQRLIAGDTRGDPSSKQPSLLTVESASPFKSGLLVQFREIDDRVAAELWRDRYLLVPAEEVPPVPHDQIHQHELVGLAVEAADGTSLGMVDGLYDLPQGLMLDVRRGSSSFLVPYRDEFVRRVDPVSRTLVVQLPEGYLD